jgi:hypothetical protein
MTQPGNEEAQRPPLLREIRVLDIEDNAPQTIEATAAEREAIRTLLDLVAVKSLRFDYRLRRGGGGRIHVSGRLTAEVTQTCVISLEPLEASIDTPVEMEFWPEALVADLERKTEDPGQAGLLDWPETIVDGTLELGRVVYEILATALEPYPRKEGASFEWSEGAGATEGPKAGPFAALGQLKKR